MISRLGERGSARPAPAPNPGGLDFLAGMGLPFSGLLDRSRHGCGWLPWWKHGPQLAEPLLLVFEPHPHFAI